MAPVILPRLEDDEVAEHKTGEIPLIPADDEPGMALSTGKCFLLGSPDVTLVGLFQLFIGGI